ncbi:hypothetical protein COCSUDRAFT_43500 [Coccomyxa subellipsoidea C-169]|uniref:Magnesium transporter n=1 Tax=Coccomyxa subellipsoidea (strain C-169) TaxID=574566 RepID=I0YRZ7_COCSC|nr:hypothetical protein COCSUDRAFT_43500 [Coccomyxa subellipsoidea C-169]EIE21166.1 hypothetical protein COCSUDRAFT_43500 [Coccomyxa subellipsoidea C-169]|eukprot:XP_005645710.1 hypothetical protein COCSUDRAFT_43500 [Coccomyxa subellipsoidea C-169]
MERRLPFELKVLEAALAETVDEMSTEVSELVDRAMPALDALVQRVSRRELDTVREVKASLQGIFQRTQRLQEELETLLDDDEDMADMYLTRRAQAEERRHRFNEDRRHSAAEQGLDHPLEEHVETVSDSSLASCNTPHGFSHRVEVKSHVDPRSIEECENLLETYFMQVDFLISRLNLLKESIDDTEDLINIELDQRRNQIVAMNLIVSVFAAGFGLIAAIAGICGMNLLPLPIEDTTAPFIGVTVGSCTAGMLVIVSILAWAKYKRVLDFIPQLDS